MNFLRAMLNARGIPLRITNRVNCTSPTSHQLAYNYGNSQPQPPVDSGGARGGGGKRGQMPPPILPPSS